MENRNNFWEIAFASLLHDIGKFYKRSSRVRNEISDISDKHPIYTILISKVLKDQFSSCHLDIDRVTTIAVHHHESRSFGNLSVNAIEDANLKLHASLISEADNISSGERYSEEEERRGAYERASYESIFSFISKNERGFAETAYIKADRLDKDIQVFFNSEQGYADYDHLVGEFNKNLSNIRIPEIADLEARRWSFFISLLSILRFYTFFVPSDVTVRRDVSLFDHMKTTSAIATCLYLWHLSHDNLSLNSIKDRNEKKFLLLGGEVGGIQNYITNIRNVASEGGVAKRLRARSFKINALSVAIATWLAKQLGLTYASVIYNTGGKILMLAPNTKEILEKLKSFKLEISKLLIEDFGGIFNFNLTWVEASANDLIIGEEGSNCARTIERFESALNREKFKPLKTYLIEENVWLDNRFVLKGKWEEGEYCAVCESFPGTLNDKGVRVCKLCEEEKTIGGRLLGKKFALITEREGAGYSLFGNIKIELTDKFEFSADDLIAFNIDNEKIGDLLRINGEFPSGLDLRFSPYYAPVYEKGEVSEGEDQPVGGIKTFETLANLSTGDKSLGVLKADVDRLGFILSSCFPNMSLSRLSTFSFLLDYFFSFRFLNVIKREFKETYIVYAGGDDLFCLGPWNDIVAIVPRLNNEFYDWVAHNPLFSISSAVVIIDSRIPFGEISKLSNEELKNAKSKRGTVSIFGINLSYEDFEQVSSLTNQISNLLNDPAGSQTVSRNTLRKVVEIYKEWEEYKKRLKSAQGFWSLPLFAPHLAYVVYREEAFKDEEKLNSSLKKYLGLLKKATMPSKADKIMPKLGVLTALILLATRKET